MESSIPDIQRDRFRDSNPSLPKPEPVARQGLESQSPRVGWFACAAVVLALALSGCESMIAERLVIGNPAIEAAAMVSHNADAVSKAIYPFKESGSSKAQPDKYPPCEVK